MDTRTTSKTVTFRRPFFLAGFGSHMPPGDYVVDTDEELLQSLSFPVYVRVSTIIHLPGKSKNSLSACALTIDPLELETAIRHDRRPPELKTSG